VAPELTGLIGEHGKPLMVVSKRWCGPTLRVSY
jgi:hypothetical protein